MFIRQGNIYDGARALPWPLYLEINKWLLQLGTPEGIFGAAFSKATVNLACRGDSTGQICTKHFMWAGDSFGIPFSHSKDSQTGEDPTKRLPRQCYCNPLDQAADFISSIFHYMVLNPDVIAHPDGLLFQGSRDTQGTNFGRVLKQVCLRNVDKDGTPRVKVRFQ